MTLVGGLGCNSPSITSVRDLRDVLVTTQTPWMDRSCNRPLPRGRILESDLPVQYGLRDPNRLGISLAVD